MSYIYKDVIQRQRQWDIYKDVNKGNGIYTKMSIKAIYIQRCKQRCYI